MCRAYNTYGEKMNAYTILVGKRLLGRPRRGWEDRDYLKRWCGMD
jgi:hypothetical protein